MLALCYHLLAAGSILVPALAHIATQLPAQDPVHIAEREADVHNYVVTRLRLVKRGCVVEQIKSEIVNEIDLGAVSGRSVELLRRMLGLCDQAIAEQAKLSGELAALDSAAANEDAKAATEVGKALLAAAASSTPLPLVTALSHLQGESDARQRKANVLAESAAKLGADISSMEFDLSVLRSQLQSEAKLGSGEFVSPADYDAFLMAAENRDKKKRDAGVTAALERSPRLQPAALHLATRFYEKRDFTSSLRYAEQVITTAPQILRHDALRAQACYFKAGSALEEKDYIAAAKWSDLGLQDDPGNPSLLSAKSFCLLSSGDYAGGLHLLEKLVLLTPDDEAVQYNLACCYAVAKKDSDAALACLRAALERGFVAIGHAKQDPDLALVRTQRSAEFDALTCLRLRLEMDWAILDADDLVVTNESAFPLVEVALSVTFSGTSAWSASTKPWSVERTLTIGQLWPGKTHRFGDVVNTTRDELRSVHVVARGPQGHFEATYSRQELERRPGGR